MKVVFVSNYFNHHQKPFCDAMHTSLGADFVFVATERVSDARLKLGYADMDHQYPYVTCTYDSEKELRKAKQLIMDADVVIYGSAPKSFLQERLQADKLTFKYAERPYKKGCPYHKLPWHFYLNTKKYRRYKNCYILCASAYTSADYAKTFTFWNKAYKWGYFTELKRYEDVEKIIGLKHPASILWVARLIGLKHPEHAIAVAKRLKSDGYRFQLDLIGNGELENTLRDMIRDNDLEDCVRMQGVMKPEQVREHMEKSEIFLFTSDKNEGWGAVLNESMNSACAVVASHVIGSVPFLMKDGENGLVYKSGDVDELYRKVKFLLDNEKERKRLAKNAYTTMVQEWNAENAAKKLLRLCEHLLAGEKHPFPFDSGVCSNAERMKDNWK